MKIVLTALLTLATLGLTGPLMAFEPDKNDALELDVARAIVNIRKADPGIETFFENAAGYAVFPSIGKGGVIVGGAYGKGLVIVDDKDQRHRLDRCDAGERPERLGRRRARADQRDRAAGDRVSGGAHGHGAAGHGHQRAVPAAEPAGTNGVRLTPSISKTMLLLLPRICV